MTYSELRTAMEAMGKLMPWQAPEALRHPLDQKVGWFTDHRLRAIRHLKWMVRESLSWDRLRAEKLNRWLGFVQGALWAFGYATIEELRQVNLGAKEMEGPHRDGPACTCTGIGDGCSMPCPVHP